MSVSLVEAGRREGTGSRHRQCVLCEHRCEVNRFLGERGLCRATAEARVYRHRVEYGEEFELVPSHLFYLSGCNLRCVFCIAEENGIDPQRGQPLTARLLADAVAWGQRQGARNIQWVGGEPTIHIPAILDAMDGCLALPPVVWKSNFYHTPKAMHLLQGVVEVYVADLKFGNDACARRITGADRYIEVVRRNLLIAAEQSELIVRHLLLPGHFDCCFRPIVHWMREQLPTTKFNVLGGYLPCWQARRYTELRAPLGRNGLARARRLAVESGLNVIR